MQNSTIEHLISKPKLNSVSCRHGSLAPTSKNKKMGAILKRAILVKEKTKKVVQVCRKIL